MEQWKYAEINKVAKQMPHPNSRLLLIGSFQQPHAFSFVIIIMGRHKMLGNT